MVAGLLVSGYWAVSHRLLGCQSVVAGLLFGDYWVVSKWLLGC